MLDQSIQDVRDNGYCVLKQHLPPPSIARCRDAFWPVLRAYLEEHGSSPNRGPQRHYLPMPFEPPCFEREFFFDSGVLAVVRHLMDDRIVADQWGCDVALPGSTFQNAHIDYHRPLFPEAPGMHLPVYILVVSFALLPITPDNGPIEIAPGTHRLPAEASPRPAAFVLPVPLQPVLLEPGDVLIRHPRALHRGSPNRTGAPRPLVSIRYVRRWYSDDSRPVNSIPQKVWQSLSIEEQSVLRFPVGSR